MPAHLSCTFQQTLRLFCETGSFSYCGNLSHSPQPPRIPLKSAPPEQPTELSSQPCPQGPRVAKVFLSQPARSAALLVWLFWLIFSLIPLLSEFHAVCFSGSSVYLLTSDWLLSSFWFFKEAKGFYLCLHLGWNSCSSFSKLLQPFGVFMVPYKFLKCSFYICDICHGYSNGDCIEAINYFG